MRLYHSHVAASSVGYHRVSDLLLLVRCSVRSFQNCAAAMFKTELTLKHSSEVLSSPILTNLETYNLSILPLGVVAVAVRCFLCKMTRDLDL